MIRRSEWTVFKEYIEMNNKLVKICSTSLIIWEMQIKTTMKCNLIHSTMTIIKKSSNNKCWARMWSKRNSCAVTFGMYTAAATIAQKIKNRTLIWASTSTSRYLSEENESSAWKYMHLYIHYNITKIAKIWKQPKYPSRNKWIKDTSLANHSVFGDWELFQLAYLSLWYISIKTHAIFSSISLFSGILLLLVHLVYFMTHCHNQLLFFLEKFWFLYCRMSLETKA